MRLIDSEAYYSDLSDKCAAIKDDSLTKQGIRDGLRLAMDVLAKTPPVWDRTGAWNEGLPCRDGRYIVMYDGRLIEGFRYRGVLYGKKTPGKPMVRLAVGRIEKWTEWPEERKAKDG